jgi:hypothetical protein
VAVEEQFQATVAVVVAAVVVVCVPLLVLQ